MPRKPFDESDIEETLGAVAARRPPEFHELGDWSDQRAALRASLDDLQNTLDNDLELSGTDRASLLREKRITLSELASLGKEVGVSRLSQMKQEGAARRLRLLDGGK